MSRIAIFFTLLFCGLVALAAPLNEGNATVIEDLDKRITHTGRGTWFNVGLGNCGYRDVDSSPIVAISKARYDSNGGANCNQWVRITNTANGKWAYGKTRDSCESCDTSSLDMSPSLFKSISTLSTGQITISWHFMAAGWKP